MMKIYGYGKTGPGADEEIFLEMEEATILCDLDSLKKIILLSGTVIRRPWARRGGRRFSFALQPLG